MSPERIRVSIAAAPLSELRRRFEMRSPGDAVLRALRVDPRAGVQRLAEQLERRRLEERRERRRLARLYRREAALRAMPEDRVAGVDEVGMGPLAGPVVAAAVILPGRPRLAGLDDSKRLRPDTRAELAEAVRRVAVALGIGIATREEIDRLNIYHAGLLAMRRALESLATAPDQVALDGRTLPGLALPQHRCVGGDGRIACIAAASIVAKHHRDALMAALDARYPGYGFARHAGYATREHLEALERLGPTPEHRRSFAPVRERAIRERARERTMRGEASCPTS